jgi:hypothetical protein
MLPPMMPFLHDAFWLGLFAGLALFAWRMANRYDLRLSALDMKWPLARGEAPASSWFTATTAPATRSSGNTAFDDWRDGELAKIEAQRQALETRLAAFEGFVDKLKRAKDRQTFERFMAENGEVAHSAGAAVDHEDHRPA